jgi:hypothetical protein
MSRVRIRVLIVILLLLGPPGVRAQQDASSVTLEDVFQMLQKQQKMIESQQATIDGLSARLDDVAPEKPQIAGSDTAPPSGDSARTQKQTDSIDQEMADQRMSKRGMPPNVITAGEFPGSISIPGTDMAGKVGGNARVALVNNFDPIGSNDQFIAGEIPVPGDSSSADGDLFEGANISAKRSQLNLDMRMDSNVGQFRAYIEGDFVTEVGSSDVFQLRHAYGQYKGILVGQTWTTLMDLRAEPEELDFEGLNGEIVLRHPLMRWGRALGENRRLTLSLEDPTPGIANGDGKSDTPDLVSTINLQRDTGHVQFGGLLRNIKGQQAVDTEDEMNDGETRSGTVTGWGLSFSGSQKLKAGGGHDRLMWQLNLGEGFGGYINDTASLGDLDAVFSPDGTLKALPVFGGYVALEHFWIRDPLAYFGAKGLLKNLRSSLVYGYTSISNFDFQPDDAYSETQRASVNLIWSPMEQIDVGFEYLWGTRKNKDGRSGAANQLQLVVTYNF